MRITTAQLRRIIREEVARSLKTESWGDDDGWEGGPDFADPGGRSALRRPTSRNPRNQPCPTCGEPDVLTPEDVRMGYQCDACADRDEGLSGY